MNQDAATSDKIHNLAGSTHFIIFSWYARLIERRRKILMDALSQLDQLIGSQLLVANTAVPCPIPPIEVSEMPSSKA